MTRAHILVRCSTGQNSRSWQRRSSVRFHSFSRSNSGTGGLFFGSNPSSFRARRTLFSVIGFFVILKVAKGLLPHLSHPITPGLRCFLPQDQKRAHLALAAR